nr:hypothetical protein [Burkholderia cenocepacia]
MSERLSPENSPVESCAFSKLRPELAGDNDAAPATADSMVNVTGVPLGNVGCTAAGGGLTGVDAIALLQQPPVISASKAAASGMDFTTRFNLVSRTWTGILSDLICMDISIASDDAWVIERVVASIPIANLVAPPHARCVQGPTRGAFSRWNRGECAARDARPQKSSIDAVT